MYKIGTHIFLFDLRQIHSSKQSINKLTNYELLFDYEKKDIFHNLFECQVSERNFIDVSLKNYLKYFYLTPVGNANVFLFNEKVKLYNPYYLVRNNISDIESVEKIWELKVNKDENEQIKKSEAIICDGEIYKGFIFNCSFIEKMLNNENFSKIATEQELNNGLLIYIDNKLVCRNEQSKLGDIYFFVEKIEKAKGKSLFAALGYLEIPNNLYELLPNKMVMILS